MKNVLILHGTFSDHNNNWFPWLKSELENRGYKVIIPDLPFSKIPDQQELLDAIFLNPQIVFNKDTIIIGHSGGATLAVRILEKLPSTVCINKTILISGAYTMGRLPEHFKYKESLINHPFDWEKIKNSSKSFCYICSDNDPYSCGQEESQLAQKNLGGDIIFKSGEGHFNLETSPKYKEFPLLLEIVKD